MPKVTDAHLAARRQQILDAARTCFLHNGFHATSMQQVIAEAGLSVGAVYRYFPSKNELIAAIAEQVVGEMDALLAGSAQPGVPLVEVLTQAVDAFQDYLGPDGPVRMAVQLWAEALRDPRLAEFVGGVYQRLRSRFVELARTAQRSGELSATADPEAVGATLFALFPGYGLQQLLTGSPGPEEFKAGIRVLLRAHPGKAAIAR
ncbi:MAG: TetR/AcrR family transcriptional regulator [Micromonosporaceae bacterium]|nr:TetR/AcrR family transcriptional regulator [Micromonosporaceae bacterium]